MTETQFATVSEWMTNGNINHFVAEHWDANRFELVGFCSYSYHTHFSLTIIDFGSWETSQGG